MTDTEICADTLMVQQCQLPDNHGDVHQHHTGAALTCWPTGWSEMTPMERMSWVESRDRD